MPRAAAKKVETTASIMAAINKHYGAGTMRRASDPELLIQRIPCGVLSIDVRLGGGFARGRHTEIYGAFSVGKSYLSLCLIATAQAAGEEAAYLDAEGSFDPVFAASVGVDLERLHYVEQREVGNAHRLLDVLSLLLSSDLYAVVVVDSTASLVPKSESEQPLEAATMGTAQARLMSQALRKLTTTNKRTAVIWINQTREAVGVMFGDRTVTSGGRAMGFYAGTRIELVRTENIKKKGRVVNPSSGVAAAKDIVVGHRVLARIRKEKTGGSPNQATTSFVFSYELGGVDHIEDLMYLGRHYRLVGKKGSAWWVYGYEDEAQNGRAKFYAWLKLNVAVAEELEDNIRQLAQGDSDAEDEEE